MSDWLSRMAEQSGLSPGLGDGTNATLGVQSALPLSSTDGLQEEHSETTPAMSQAGPILPPRQTAAAEATPAASAVAEPQIPEMTDSMRRAEPPASVSVPPEVSELPTAGVQPTTDHTPPRADVQEDARLTREQVSRLLRDWIASNEVRIEAEAPLQPRVGSAEQPARKRVEELDKKAQRPASAPGLPGAPLKLPDLQGASRGAEARVSNPPFPVLPAHAASETVSTLAMPEASVALSIGSIHLTIEAPVQKPQEPRLPLRERAPGVRTAQAALSAPRALPAADGTRLNRRLVR